MKKCSNTYLAELNGKRTFFHSYLFEYFCNFLCFKKVIFVFPACVAHFYIEYFAILSKNVFPSRKYENKSSARRNLLEMSRT